MKPSVPLVLTPPGMEIPSRVTPEAGTTRGSGDATPGLILKDSLITAVCHNQISAENNIGLFLTR